ncbi:MAG: ATP-dependent DNA ligase [Naasia sp.]
MAERAQTVTVDGRRLRVTNLDKVLYPATGTTKADVLDYYARIADALVPHTRDRPLTRKRWVHGVGTADEPGEVFFQKNLDEGTPDWVARRSLSHSSRTSDYPLANDRATLAWLAQIAALELHVPQWRFGSGDEQLNPDRLVLDLDPGEGTSLADCVRVAHWAREILEDIGLTPLPVTSGSKGIHLYAPLDGTRSSDVVAEFAHELARVLEADHGDLVVSDMKKTLRAGKVLVDWSQNNGAKTTIAPYSLRGREHPTVAAPRSWDELDDPGLAQLDYREVLERVERMGDLLAELDPLPAPRDRLATYRGMRDADRTPEPVPAAPSTPSDGRSFVIQEHHATRLHFDFRLEHDGVLVSWAVPKNVPVDTRQNHLAVHTEDHPLEYGSFEGEIPRGEYGGGRVRIWDTGTYELEKWRDDEVIVILHGTRADGLGEPVKVALIRTRQGGDEKDWLMHRMQLEAPSAEGTTPERAEKLPPSPYDAVGSGPMLASPGSAGRIDDPSQWVFEMKWDGIRALVDVDADRDPVVRLTSRAGNDLTASYPELRAIADSCGPRMLIDGEIVALDPTGRPDFGLLQKRMNLASGADIQRAVKEVPVRFVVFDLLADGGESLLGEPYDRRRQVLEERIRPTAMVQVPSVLDGSETSLDDAVSISGRLGLEGVVAKRRTSDYAPGRRSGAWLKIKHSLMQEVVVGGWRPGRGRREGGLGSLLLGVPGPDGLDYVGRVGTGFTDRDLDALLARLTPLAAEEAPFHDVPRADAADAHWVTPTLVGEVEFAEWTSSGHLRQPSWRGWRPDKSPAEVIREKIADQA